LGGCVLSGGQAPPAVDRPAVAVERDAYRVLRRRDGLELTIVATFTNRTADTVVLHPCGQRGPAVALEKWDDGAWRSAFDQACPDVLVRNAPRLAPGESRTDTAGLFASLRPDARPRFRLETVRGHYRIVYWQAHGPWQPDGSLGQLLPKALRVSNAFRVVE
jgi:hypothetical protein